VIAPRRIVAVEQRNAVLLGDSRQDHVERRQTMLTVPGALVKRHTRRAHRRLADRQHPQRVEGCVEVPEALAGPSGVQELQGDRLAADDRPGRQRTSPHVGDRA